MAVTDPKDYLWKNVCFLMGWREGDPEPTIDAVQIRLKEIGRGTVQRIKEGSTSIGTDKLVQIAGAFNLEAWQLLVPGLKLPDDPVQPPHVLSSSAMRLAVHFDDMLPTPKAKEIGFQAVTAAISRARRETLPQANDAPAAVRSEEKQRD